MAASPNIENGASEAPEPLRGASLLDLANMEVPSDKTLLGKRWLCVGGGAIIVGPSGIGKSTLSVQAAALWACGRAAFGIKPTRALRVLIVQAEDDEGDSIEMAKMIELLGLSDNQRQLVGQNTHLEFLNDKTGRAFTERLEVMLRLFPAELAIINPLSAYLGDDTKDEKSVNQFLRNWINPILTNQQAAAIFIHHTPKTINRDTSDWEATEWMYSGSGVAGITNWSRAYIAIDPTKNRPGKKSAIGYTQRPQPDED
jgi:RecA-family ATPase